ncbi:MAG: DNA-binding transcriptional LysR family regulator [Myxococcota bacterium]|jgi:DNA-binding transcriptional LysR family regulator
MEITDLRYFHHVAATRSFARAAERAHISRSAVSKAVRRLEEELQTALFERTTRQVIVTEAGRILERHCVGLFEDLEAMRREIESATEAATGVLRIGAMEVFSIFALPNAVIELINRHPGIEARCFSMTPTQIEAELLDGRIDVGVVVGGGPTKHLRYHPLGTTTASLVCRPNSPLAQSGGLDVEVRAQTPFVAFDYFGSETHPMAQVCAAPAGAKSGPTVDTLSAATQLILDGPFVGFLPELAIHCQLNHRELIRVAAPGPEKELILGALTPDSPPRLATIGLLEGLQTIIAEAAVRSCGRS